MRRHSPNLYSHQEVDNNQLEEEDWDTPLPVIQTPTRPHLNSPNPTSSVRSRSKMRNLNIISAPVPMPSSYGVPQYSNIYSEFVRRYRSQPDADDDPRTDPDSHYFQRGLGQLVDAGDSDEEDHGRGSLTGSEPLDILSTIGMDTNLAHPVTKEERERLEWQTMLASVLDGDVLKSEKSRIAVALESSTEGQNNSHPNLWLGIRAKLNGRSVEEEKEILDERRLRIVDAAISEVLAFRVDSNLGKPDITSALKQVNAVIRKIDVAESLFPSLRAFCNERPVAAEAKFQARCDTLNTWHNIITSLRRQIALLRRWTGSETLDVNQPFTTSEIPIGSSPEHFRKNGPTDKADGTSFVERVLKEEHMQRTFEKGFLTTVHAFIGTARDAQVNLAHLFEDMNLPTFENELVPIISFPTKLAQASLRVRLEYVQKLKDPDVMIIDQMTEDIKLSIGLACTLKRQYEAFLTPDPGGKWTLPQSISEDYDATVLEALSMFFKLIHLKLKSGAKGIYFKETDVLEAQWATFNDVSLTVVGGSSLVVEQLCALTNKLLVRVTNFFETQVRVPAIGEPNRQVNGKQARQLSVENLGARRKMTDEQVVNWYGRILDSVRLRYRKLLRFARVLAQRFSNSADYSLEGFPLDYFISSLVSTDHFLVYTQSFEEDGTYIIAPPVLRGRPDIIQQILTESFHVSEVVSDDGIRVAGHLEGYDDESEEGGYLIILSPRSQFLWNGVVLMLEIPKIEFDLKDNRVRLVADGPQHRLVLAKQRFTEALFPVDDDGEPEEYTFGGLECVIEQQAHLPRANRELRKIARATNRLAESIVDSVHHVRSGLRDIGGCQELLENWYLFASEIGQHAQKFMDRSFLIKFNRLLIKSAISWVSFICDDCDPTDRKTFRWAVNALEFTFNRTKRNNILQLPDDQFELLRHKVASCMTLLISHFDILGARSTVEAKRERERQELLREQVTNACIAEDDGMMRVMSFDDDNTGLFIDPAPRAFWERVSKSLQELENQRVQIGLKHRALGRVLDDEKPEDRSLVFLASSSSNISIRWQQGRFIGAGAFGSVYLAVNLDSGSLMAVKEIKFQELSGLPNLYQQIKDELSVMEMLHHPNVVEYYGIEVHRDKVYIFEEYCQGGSLAALLEHGRIEDEGITQVYTMQMLEGLSYLHSRGIVHRDIKPDNILLDHLGVIKFVDFGAAKIFVKNQRSIQRSRRSDHSSDISALGGGLGMNSLTGTPMYMSPEVIKNDNRGRHGAMDIWSLGCVVLEFATGKKPWSNLDNEWAIMFHIGVATQHPPLPEPGQLSSQGINFIKQCLTIDPMKRPSATELMVHPWMLEFREALLSYEEAELSGADPPAEIPSDTTFVSASVARQAAIVQEKEVEAIQAESPSLSPLETPTYLT